MVQVQNLKDFLKKYGVQTTTNFDLVEIAKQLNIPNFHVVMRNEIKELDKQTKFPVNVVSNLHISSEPGIHWNAFVYDRETAEGGNNYFFDSYGLPPTREVKDLLKHASFNTFKLQIPGTKLCGQLCMYVLYKLNNNVPFIDILLEIRQNLA